MKHYLKEWFEYQNIDLNKLSIETGISMSLLKGYMKGYCPSINFFYKISKKMGVSINDLIEVNPLKGKDPYQLEPTQHGSLLEETLTSILKEVQRIREYTESSTFTRNDKIPCPKVADEPDIREYIDSLSHKDKYELLSALCKANETFISPQDYPCILRNGDDK